MRDLRDAFRSLVATPVVSVVAILSLALGIGANTAIFSILDSLILRTLPVKEPQRLVMIDRGSWTNPIWEAIRDRQQAFDGATAWSPTRFNLAAGGQTEMVDGVWASGRFFEVLGTSAILGRTFARDDDRRGGGPDGPVAVISYSFWQRRFGGSADVIGNPLMVERVSYTMKSWAMLKTRSIVRSANPSRRRCISICRSSPIRHRPCMSASELPEDRQRS